MSQRGTDGGDLLAVQDLRTHFFTQDGVVKAVDGVSFGIRHGETLGIVGESGCGKSVTCLTIMGLNDPRSATSTGEVLFRGEDILKASPSRLRELRRARGGLVPQGPVGKLDLLNRIDVLEDQLIVRLCQPQGQRAVVG